MKNHFRKDYSSYHVIDYDTLTGAVLHKNTHQGYSDASAWSRGQAWGLYGYTMCYRETGLPEFLERAKQIASYIFSNPTLPDDLIPYWDYNAPGIPDEPRDVSAATVTASALYELSMYDETNRTGYVDRADRILEKSDEPLSGKCRERLWFSCFCIVPVPRLTVRKWMCRSYMRIITIWKPCCEKPNWKKKELLSCKIN